MATATSINGTTIPTSATLVTTAAGTATAATTAVTATNIAGGAASQIPYQTGAGATSFIANGTAGQVLTSNGASAPSWASAAGGGGLTLIASTTTAAGATSASLTSIPQTYKALKLMYWFTGSMAYPSSAAIKFNAVSSGYHYGYISQATSGGASGGSASGGYGAYVSALTVPSTTSLGVVTINIENYSSTVVNKTMSVFSLLQYASSGVSYGAAGWSNTAAITSIDFTMNPGAGVTTTIQLYGVS